MILCLAKDSPSGQDVLACYFYEDEDRHSFAAEFDLMGHLTFPIPELFSTPSTVEHEFSLAQLGIPAGGITAE